MLDIAAASGDTRNISVNKYELMKLIAAVVAAENL
jgi:hypothetical protein